VTATATASARAFQKLALGAGTTFAAKIVNTGTKFVTQIALCRLLGAEGFGLYALCIVVYQVGELVAGLGLESGAVRFVSIYNGSGDQPRLKGTLRRATLLPFVVGLVLCGILLVTADPLANWFFAKPDMATALKIVAIALPFGATMTVLAFATTGFGVTHYLALIWTLHPLANLVLAVVLCLLGFGLEGAAAGWVIASILSGGFALLCVRRIAPTLTDRSVKPISETKKLLSFSLPLAFGNFLWLVLLWTDIVVLGHYGSEFDVGLYRATSQTSLLLTLIIVSFNTIFAPTIADLLHKNEVSKTRDLFKTSTRWSLTATVPIFLVLIVSGGDILRIFDVRFASGAIPLLALAIGQLVTAGTGSCGQILAMSGHQYLKLFGDLAMAVGNVVLNLILIPRWGIMGAAVATAISVAAVHVVRLMQVYVVLKLTPYDLRYLKVIIAGAIAGLAGNWIRPSLNDVYYLFSVAMLSAIMIGLYGVLLWAMGLEQQDRTLLRNAYAAVRRRTT